MSTAIALRSNWLARAAGWTLRALRLATVEAPRPEEVIVGSDFTPGMAAQPSYDPNVAMSAYPSNGWLAACVEAIAWDTAGLPLRAVSGDDELDAHPALDLFPALLRAQLIADYVLAGNAYLLELVGPRGMPVGVLRLHPARVRVVHDEHGNVAAYQMDWGDGRTVNYRPDAVHHVRGISWEKDARGAYGQGAIRPIDADLRADRALAEASRRSASAGRPAAVYSPAGDGVTWSTAQVRDMRANVDKLLQADGGVAVLSGHGKLSPLGWSPREMEGVAQRSWTRETILAVMGVPPSRVGLPTANYATQREQMATYWQTQLLRLSQLEEAYTAIAEKFGGSPVEIHHDVSLIQPLQPSQSEALARVRDHIANGLAPLAAYHLEGFDEVGPEHFAAPVDLPAMDEDTAEAIERLRRAYSVIHDPAADPVAVAGALSSVESALRTIRVA